MKKNTEIDKAIAALSKLGGDAYYAKYGGEGMSELGKKGSKARAEKLTPAQRSEIARKAVQARWAKRRATGTDADQG